MSRAPPALPDDDDSRSLGRPLGQARMTVAANARLIRRPGPSRLVLRRGERMNAPPDPG
jgi:hypothetical protein